MGMLALATLASFSVAAAHEVRPAYLEIRESVPGRYQVVWKVPQRGEYVLGLRVLWPPGARDAAPPAEESVGDALIQRRVMEFGRDGLVGKSIAIDGLATTTTDVLIRIELFDGRVQTHLLKPGNAGFIVPARRSTFEVARDYLGDGHRAHLAAGSTICCSCWDCCCWSAGSRASSRPSPPLRSRTASRSDSRPWGWFAFRKRPVEAAIALSIVFLARELIEGQRGNAGLATRRPWLMSFGFGLLHGFGFAGALSAVGLPQGDVPLALAGFNAGVEVGQLLFVAVALIVVAARTAYRGSRSRLVASRAGLRHRLTRGVLDDRTCRRVSLKDEDDGKRWSHPTEEKDHAQMADYRSGDRDDCSPVRADRRRPRSTTSRIAATVNKVFPKGGYSTQAGKKYPTRVFFGDTHLHTSASMDAGAFGCRLGPADGYRFARGEELLSSTGVPVRLSRPLDFLGGIRPFRQPGLLSQAVRRRSQIPGGSDREALARDGDGWGPGGGEGGARGHLFVFPG